MVFLIKYAICSIAGFSYLAFDYTFTSNVKEGRNCVRVRYLTEQQICHQFLT